MRTVRHSDCLSRRVREDEHSSSRTDVTRVTGPVRLTVHFDHNEWMSMATFNARHVGMPNGAPGWRPLITGATNSLNPYAGNAGDAVDMLAHGSRIAASGRSR
jgi:hypothetical protein